MSAKKPINRNISKNNDDQAPTYEEGKCESFPTFRRNNYFPGKLLTSQDFQLEQDYFINKHRLINRLVHGSGVVCGLRVEMSGYEASGEKALSPNQIRITAGIALDACGREIELPKAKDIDFATEVHGFDKEAKSALVLVCYNSCSDAIKPVIGDTSNCTEKCNVTTVKEIYQYSISEVKGVLQPPHDVAEDKLNPHDEKKLVQIAVIEILEKDQGQIEAIKAKAFAACAACSIDNCGISLAQVDFSRASDGVISVTSIKDLRQYVYSNSLLSSLIEQVNAAEIDIAKELNAEINELQKRLGKNLPKIANINWNHGFVCRNLKQWEELTSSNFNIKFTEPINSKTLNTDVINITLELTVTAVRGEIQRIVSGIRFFLPEESAAELSNETALLTYLERIPLPVSIVSVADQEVVFAIAKTNLFAASALLRSESLRNLLAHKTQLKLRLIIQLKGDFVTDKASTQYLDAHFLRGYRSFGYDIEGGMFESWFSVHLPEVVERLELDFSANVQDALRERGKKLNDIIENILSADLKIADLKILSREDLVKLLGLPDEVATSSLPDSIGEDEKAADDLREINELTYDSMKQMRTEGIATRAQIAGLLRAYPIALETMYKLPAEKADAIRRKVLS
jgi:hypothetical protein